MYKAAGLALLIPDEKNNDKIRKRDETIPPSDLVGRPVGILSHIIFRRALSGHCCIFCRAAARRKPIMWGSDADGWGAWRAWANAGRQGLAPVVARGLPGGAGSTGLAPPGS